MKPNVAIEAYIKVTKAMCPVAESAKAAGGKVSLFFLKTGTKTSIHRIEFRTINNGILDELRRRSVTLARLGEKKVLVESESCTVCKEFADSQILVMNAEQISDSEMLYHVLSFSPNSLNSFVNNLKKKGIATRLVLTSRYAESGALTPKQFEAISLALQSGFFDVDRKITLTELAGRLNVSTPALAEVIRRATKKIVESYLKQRIHS